MASLQGEWVVASVVAPEGVQQNAQQTLTIKKDEWVQRSRKKLQFTFANLTGSRLPTSFDYFDFIRQKIAMVLWCKTCGALMGLRPPLNDWSTDRNGVCADCLNKQTETPLVNNGEEKADVQKRDSN